MLVVIDMQPGFDSSNCRRTISNIVAEIAEARKRNEHVMIVEYNNHSLGCPSHRDNDCDECDCCNYRYGTTHNDIIEALGGYDNWSQIVKDDDDGSREILHAVGGNTDLSFNSFNLTGVNFQFCVYDTAFGLSCAGIPQENINILESCCNGPHYDNWQYYRERYSKFATIDYDDGRD